MNEDGYQQARHTERHEHHMPAKTARELRPADQCNSIASDSRHSEDTDRSATRFEREVIGYQALCGRQRSSLADPDRQAGKKQLGEVLRRAADSCHDAPESDRYRDDQLALAAIGPPRDRQTKGRVEQGECLPGEQPHLGIGGMELCLDRLDRNGHDLAIDVADRRNQKKDGKHRPAPLRRDMLPWWPRGLGSAGERGLGDHQLDANILPGLNIPLGSSARLIWRMISPPSPSSSTRASCLPSPMPCSPVQVPSIVSARATRRALIAWTSAHSPGASGSSEKMTWKLPSPTWPQIVAGTAHVARSRFVSEMHSASRPIGTQTSVAQPTAPGRRPLVA